MTASDPSVTIELGELIDRFVQELRDGQHPSVEEYAKKYPLLADEIVDVFPTLATIEHAAVDQPQRPRNVTADGKIPTQLGEYRVLREIGRGGMGVVYEAIQESLDRHVALKMLPFDALLDPRHIKRFQREVRSAAALHHPNIVPVFGVGEHETLHFYAMQYIQGLGLDEVLDELRSMRDVTGPASAVSGSLQVRDLSSNGGRASERQYCVENPSDSDGLKAQRKADSQGSENKGPGSSPSHTNHQFYRSIANVGVQVSNGIQHAHEQGVLHRDIKPSNLLLDQEGTVWVTDFGLAKSDGEELTGTGDFVGTLRYMAPERFRGWSDSRTDIYSIGLTLYELLTLQPAFVATDRAELVRQVTQESPVRPRRIDPHIPRDLETIVLKAIEKEPFSRYQTADTLADDLRRFLDGRPIIARRASLRERTTLWGRRNPVVATLSAAFVLLLLLATIGTGYQAYQLRRSIDRISDAEARAVNANHLAQDRLYESYLAQARAFRLSGRPGLRVEGLRAVTAASEIADGKSSADSRKMELRREAVACMANQDWRIDRSWKGDQYGNRSAHPRWAFDGAVTRYARELENGEFSVRSLEDDHELARLPAMAGWSFGTERPHLQFSSDGRFLGVYAEIAAQMMVQVYDVEKRQAVFSAPRESGGESHWSCIDFTPDSEVFVYLDEEHQLCRFDLATAQTQRFPVKERSNYLRVSPDGKTVAADQRWRDIVLLDFATGEEKSRLICPTMILDVAWDPAGTLIAAAASDGNIYIWDTVQPDSYIATCRGHRGSVRHVAFNSRGLLVSTAWDQTTRVWNASIGQQIMRFDFWGGALRFSQDDRWLGFEYAGYNVGRIEIVDNGECRVLTGNVAGDPVKSIDFSDDERVLLVAGQSDGVRIWDHKEQRCLSHIQPHSFSWGASLLGNDTLLAYGEPTLERWTVDRNHNEVGEALQVSLTNHEVLLRSESQVRISPRDNDSNGLIAIELATGSAQLFDLKTKQVKGQLTSTDWMTDLTISPCGRWVACGSWHSSSWQVWETESGELIREETFGGSGVGLCFSPDGNWLCLRKSDQVSFYHVGSWEHEFTIDRQQLGIAAVAFSRDMKWLAISELTYVRLFDWESRQPLCDLDGPGDVQLSNSHPAASPIQFSPDRSKLAIGSYDGSVLLWDLRKVRQHLDEMGLDW